MMSVNPGQPVCMAADGDSCSDPERQTLFSEEVGGGGGLLVGSHGFQLPPPARPTQLTPDFKSPKMPWRSTQVVFEINDESPVSVSLLDIENETLSKGREGSLLNKEVAGRNPSLTDNRTEGSGSSVGGGKGTQSLLQNPSPHPAAVVSNSFTGDDSTSFNPNLQPTMSNVPIDVDAGRSLMPPVCETGMRIEFMNGGHKRTGNASSPPEVPDLAIPFQMNASTADASGPVFSNGIAETRHVSADPAALSVPASHATANKVRKVQLLRRLRSFPSARATKKKTESGIGIGQPHQASNPSLTTPYDAKDSATGYRLQGPVITVTSHSEDDLPNDLGYFQEFSAFHFKESITKHDNRKEYQRTTSHEVSEHGKTTAVAGSSTSSYLRDQIISFFQPSDNKLAMKLFGNKNALMKEKMRQKAAGNWVIHPCSNFRFYWDIFMLILLMANLIILPIAIAFFNDDLSLQWIVFNGVSDTVFLLDLIINFRTGIIADNFADDIILEPRDIAKHYLKTWFLLDLISSLPLDYIILILSPDASSIQLIHAGRALRMFRLVKLLSLLRLLRLSRLVRYISQWQEDIGQFLAVAGNFMRIFNLVCLILLLGHWNGCLQWLVPMLQDFPSDSWIAIEELQNAGWEEQYTWSLFKALSHMLCIGYGRYPPQSTTDVWLTTVSMLTGATCYALFVGHSTTIIQSFDTSRRLYREKFKQVEEYMTYRKLPRNMRRRIADYYEHRYQGKMFDETSILAEVNECLRKEVINYNCRALVASVPFFANADPDFVTDVVTNLRYEMFQPGDYIIREGSIGTKMYFIQEGIVDVITQNGEVATSLSDGSYFGEICLLANSKRMASVRAETYCNLFSLSVEHFASVLERYPLMRRTMEGVAAQRLNKIGKDPSILSNLADLANDMNVVNELIKCVTPLPSSTSDESDGETETAEEDSPKKERRKAKGKHKDKRKDKEKDACSSATREKDSLSVKIATILRKSKSSISLRQLAKDS